MHYSFPMTLPQSHPAGIRSEAVDFALPPILDMRAARDFKKSLDELHALGRACVIEASEVTRISTGCLQVFASFIVSMSRARHAVILRRPSGIVLTNARQLGLTPILDMCKVEA